MKTVISVASVLLSAFSLDAQITATLNRLRNDLTEIRIRNNSAVSLSAFAIRLNYVPRCAQNRAPVIVYVDPAIDTAMRPLPPNQERTVEPGPTAGGCFANGKMVISFPLFEQPVLTAGIFGDGTTTGDPALLTRLLSRRSSMLQEVEMALGTLVDAGRRNVPRDQLIEQYKKFARSVSHWYLPPEQQVGRDLYQSIIGKLVDLPEQPLGSPFPPAAFIEEETAMLNRQRVTLLESQPSLADAALIQR